jgi:hypothetical protein
MTDPTGPQGPAQVPPGWSPESELHYSRRGDVVRLKASGFEGDESVHVLMGLFTQLSAEEQQRVVDSLYARGLAPSDAIVAQLQPLAQQPAEPQKQAPEPPQRPAPTLYDPSGRKLPLN